MKTHILKFSMLASICFALLAFLVSCEKEGKEPGGGGKPPIGGICSVEGTLQLVPCGPGALEGYWIRLDNGKFIQPCEIGVKITPGSYHEGSRVKFGYEQITSGGCDRQIVCLAVVPPSVKAKITCFQVLSQGKECNQSGIVLYDVKCNVKLIEGPAGKLEPVNQQLLAQYDAGARVSFNATHINTLSVTCTGNAPVQINCIRPERLCGTPVCPPLTIKQAEPGQGINIMAATVEGTCLKLKIGYSGCSANAERFILSWNGSWMKSIPAQVNLALEDSRPEMCEAYFTNEVSFDLSSLGQNQVPGEKIVIHLSGYDQPIEYTTR